MTKIQMTETKTVLVIGSLDISAEGGSAWIKYNGGGGACLGFGAWYLEFIHMGIVTVAQRRYRYSEVVQSRLKAYACLSSFSFDPQRGLSLRKGEMSLIQGFPDNNAPEKRRFFLKSSDILKGVYPSGGDNAQIRKR